MSSPIHSTTPGSNAALRPSRSIDLLRTAPTLSSSPPPPESSESNKLRLKRSKSTAAFFPAAGRRQRSASVPPEKLFAFDTFLNASPTPSTSQHGFASQQQQPSAQPAQRTSRLVKKASTLLRGSATPAGSAGGRLSRMSSTLGLRPKPPQQQKQPEQEHQQGNQEEEQGEAEPPEQPPPVPTRSDQPVLSPPAPFPLAHLDAAMHEYPFPRQHQHQPQRPQNSAVHSTSSNFINRAASPSLRANIFRRGSSSTGSSTQTRPDSQSFSSSSGGGSPSPARSSWLPRVFARTVSSTSKAAAGSSSTSSNSNGINHTKRTKQSKRASSGSTPSLQMVSEHHELPHAPREPHASSCASYQEPPMSPALTTSSAASSEEFRSGWSSFSSEASPKRIKTGTKALRRKLSRTLSKSIDNLRAMRTGSDGSWGSEFSIVDHPHPHPCSAPRHSSSSSDTAGGRRTVLSYRSSLDSQRRRRRRPESSSRGSVELHHCRSATSELEDLVQSFERDARRPLRRGKTSSDSESEASDATTRREPSSACASSSRRVPDSAATSYFPRSIKSTEADDEARSDEDDSLHASSAGNPDSLRRLRHAPKLEDMQVAAVRTRSSLDSSWGSSALAAAGGHPLAQDEDDFGRPSYETRRTSFDSTATSSFSSVVSGCAESVASRQGRYADSLQYIRPSVGDRMMDDIDSVVNLAPLAAAEASPTSTTARSLQFFDRPPPTDVEDSPQQSLCASRSGWILPEIYVPSQRSSLVSMNSILPRKHHKKRTSLRRYSADNMSQLDLTHALPPPPLPPLPPQTDFRLPPSRVSLPSGHPLDAEINVTSMTVQSRCSGMTNPSPCPVPKGRVGMLTRRLEQAQASHLQALQSGQDSANRALGLIQPVDKPSSHLSVPSSPENCLKPAVPPKNPDRLSVASSKKNRFSQRLRSSVISETIAEEAAGIQASPAWSAYQMPSAWSPAPHLPSRMSVPSPMRPRSVQIASEYEDWDAEDVDDTGFIQRRQLLLFYHEVEHELLASNKTYPDTDASLFALAGFEPPASFMDIARFIFESQARFPDPEPPASQPSTPELSPASSPVLQPQSAFDSDDASDSDELSESDLPPLPAAVTHPRTRSRAVCSQASDTSSITAPMESTSRLSHPPAQKRMSGLSAISSIEEPPAVILQASRRQVMTPKRINKKTSRSQGHLAQTKEPNVYFADKMDQQRQAALDYTANKLEGRVQPVLSSRGEAKENATDVRRPPRPLRSSARTRGRPAPSVLRLR